jgi:type IV secretory pathway TraG/TraD family ATPase VirD4
LVTALTEARKANVVMVLGFQGKAQIVDLYGPLAEALLSQPRTKLFFTTSAPEAADWVSRSIGAVEYLRHRTSQSQQPQGRNTESQQRDLVREALVMDSKIMGLEPLEVYFKHGLYAVHMWLKYIELPVRQPAFVPRKRASVRTMLEAGQTLQTSPASTSSEQQLAPQSSTAHQQEFVE